MLLEFSIQNFRSIRERQTFSMVASTDKTFLDTHTVSVEGVNLPTALRSCVLYGANGSGKTNLLFALQYFQLFVAQSFSLTPGAPTGHQPFALQPNAANSAGEFEITLILEGVRYQFGFKLDGQRVLEEWVMVFKTQKGQIWYERTFNPQTQKDEYKFSDKLTGAKKIWQDATRPNALFLSTAVQFNSEMLKPLFAWIAGQMTFVWPDKYPPTYTISRLGEQEFLGEVVRFLKRSDISISDIRLDQKDNRPLFAHTVEQQEYFFDLHDESLGTQRLFALAGPILDILAKGRLLIVDELESSLHPLLVQRLVEVFHDPERNRHGAQIIFTTHSTVLLDQETLRRDQIWFVDKNEQQATVLNSLAEYRVRNDLVIDKAYLKGRFGAIPVFPGQSL